MTEETALALIAALNRLSVAMDRLVLPDNKLGNHYPALPAPMPGGQVWLNGGAGRS